MNTIFRRNWDLRPPLPILEFPVTTVAAIRLALALAFVVPPATAASGNDFTQETSLDEGAALVLLADPSGKDLNRTVQELEATGVRVQHVFPPRCLICRVPPEVEPAVLAHPSVTALRREPVEQSGGLEPSDNLALGIGAWNRLIAPAPLQPLSAGSVGEPLVGDALPHPPDDGRGQMPSAGAGDQASTAPAFTQTTEYMIGKVAVGIVLPESTGNAENWSSERQEQVIAEITAGCNWWINQGGSQAHVSFYYDVHKSVPTQYEPIQRPYNDESLWIPDTMKALGYSGSSRFVLCRQYINDLRADLGCDWGFVIFVVDSLNDSNGKFSDGYFAYAYLNGPFMVMTYDNNGYGISNMDVVTAHEIGHVFGALDEYAGASSCEDYGGYLSVKNGNHVLCSSPADDTCVMRGGIRRGLCSHSRGQLGWRDTDGDGLFDPVDTTVSVTLDVRAGPTGFVLAGTATDTPFPPGARWHNPCTLNVIKGVQARVDGGGWCDATAVDGCFDSSLEAYTFTTGPLSQGRHSFEVRAWNSVGNSVTAAHWPPPAQVLVDWRSTCRVPDGTPACPFPTVPDGLRAVAECGVIKIAAGRYPGPMLLSKCARFESNGGRVELGGSGRPGPLSAEVEGPQDNGSDELGNGRGPEVPVINSLVLRADGTFALALSVIPGCRYEVYTSTDLVNWSLWRAFTAETTVYDLVDAEPASVPARFFRVVTP